MTDRIGKDSVYRKEYQDFVTKLQRFHDNKRTTFTRIPSFGGKDLDLLLLYKTVTSLGGFSKVTDEKKWSEVAKCLNLPLKCTNGAFALRQHYIRYLEQYERVNFFGEDAEDTVTDGIRQSLSLPSGRLQAPGALLGQLGGSDLSKPLSLGPLGELRTHNFSKLMFSLASGLPNEVDFALNICTLLSNVTNSIFNLAKAPGIVDLLLLHAGIWTTETQNAQDMYKEWYQESERDFVKFWREALDDNCAKEVFESGLSGSDLIESRSKIQCDEHEIDKRSFFTDTTTDLDDAETNRVLQICVILHNFSFEDLNAMFLATHRGAKRFLMLCAGTRHSTMRKIALDTLDNLADRFTLTRLVDHESQKFLQMLHNFLESRDRCRRVRAMTILAKLAACEDNEEILSDGMTLEAYESLIRSLTIPDIQIILASLDSLYFLSHLGEATATSIAMVYGAIDVLICLITVHAESYGNRAIAGFRIVENKNSIFCQKHSALRSQKTSSLRHGPSQTVHQTGPPPLPAQQFLRTPFPPVRPPTLVAEPQRQGQPETEETEEIDADVFTAQWISAFYELSPSHTLSRSDMYSDYLVTCNRLGRLGILPASNFNKILRMVIPEQHLQGALTNLDGHYNISGVKRRATPLPVQSRVPRQRASIPVVGIHGNSPIPNTFAQNLVQNRVLAPSMPMQRPLTTPFLPAQRSSMPSDTFQSPRLRPDFPGVSVRQSFQGSTPPLTGAGPNLTPRHGTQVSVQMPQSPGRQASPIHKEGGDTVSKTHSSSVPQVNEGTKNSNDPSINVSINPDNVTTSTNSPLPPNTISLSVTPAAQDAVTQYQTAVEHIKREVQQHFMQFHFHRQQIDAIQKQLQLAMEHNQGQQLPQNIMEEIQTRVRGHQVQMQLHYQKLHQLQVLMQQVQQKTIQEQQSTKDVANDTVSASPKSKRNKKVLPQTPKSSVPSVNISGEKQNPPQPAQSHASSLPNSPQQSNTPRLSFPGTTLPNPVITTVSVLDTNYNTSTQSGDPTNQVSSQPQMVQLNPVVNGLQGHTANSMRVTKTEDGPSLPSASISSVSEPVTQHLSSPLHKVTSTQTDTTPQTVLSLSQTTRGSISNPKQIGPGPPLSQPCQPDPSLQNPNPISTPHLISANNQPRFMIFQGQPQIFPQNGAQRFPPNAMIMMPPVGFQPVLGGLPTVLSQASMGENRQQPILPKEFHNATVSQMTRPTLPLVRIQGSLNPISSHSNVSQPPVFASSAMRPNASTQASVNLTAAINSNVTLTSGQQTSEAEVSSAVTIPVYLQNGSLHAVGKNEPFQNQFQHRHTPNITIPSTQSDIIVSSNETTTNSTKLQVENDMASKYPNSQLNSSKPNEGEIDLMLQKPISHVNQAKRLCDELFEKEGLEKDNKRRKLIDEVTKLDKQDKSVCVLNGVLENRIIQNHERNMDKNDVWLNGLHSPNSIKTKENGLSKHIELLTETDSRNAKSKTSTSEEVIDKIHNEPHTSCHQNTRTHSEKLSDRKEQNRDDFSDTTMKNSRETSNLDLSNSGTPGKNSSSISSLEPTENLSSGEEVVSNVDLTTVKNKRDCLWEGCSSSFTTSSNLLSHMVCSHAPVEGQLGICRIPGCSSVQRPRGSMIYHFQQRHCSRSGSGNDLPQVTLPELLFPKVADLEKKEDESPVTRTVRLTSALILRNIAKNSSYGRQLIRGFEGRLVLSAMSTSEASGAVASCLAELSKRRTTSQVSFCEQDS